MKVKTSSSPFGSATRTRIMLALELLSESYPRELERALSIPVSVLQKAILSLERDGLVAGRTVGRSRLLRINPRYFAYGPLKAYLRLLAAADADLQKRVGAIRRRPRRTGKPL